MLTTYLKIAWRNIIKERQFALLNLIGLAIGLTSALLIYLWIHDQYSVDQFFPDRERIHQVMLHFKESGDRIETREWTPGPLGRALEKDMPEVQYATTVAPVELAEKGVLTNGDKQLRVTEILATSHFFNVFGYAFVDGSGTGLANIDNVVISDELARKLFNTDRGLVGKTVQWAKQDVKGAYTISGVFRKPTARSTLQFDLVLPFEIYRRKNSSADDWASNEPSTYFLAKPNSNVGALNGKLKSYLEARTGEDQAWLSIRKFPDRYLRDQFVNGVQSGGRISYVRLFMWVGIIILTVAGINFVNLSTARGIRRLREVGVKKVFGASRPALIVQFIVESVLMAFLALLVSAILIIAIFPVFGTVDSVQWAINVQKRACRFPIPRVCRSGNIRTGG